MVGDPFCTQGMEKMKVEPDPFWLSTSTHPSWALAMYWTRESPKPVPLSLVVK